MTIKDFAFASTLLLATGVSAATASAQSLPDPLAVRASDQDVNVTRVRAVTVAPGEAVLTLAYQIDTDEYPTYVLDPDNPYNDRWSVAVFGPHGEPLSVTTRRINDQVTASQPLWRTSGDTAIHVETIDIADYPQGGEFTLFLSSTNVGDGDLDTIVKAALTPGSNLNITDMQLVRDGLDTHNDGNYVSLPVLGENTQGRTLRVQCTGPAGYTIDRVSVELVGSDSNLLATLMTQATTADPRVVPHADGVTLQVGFGVQGNPSSPLTEAGELDSVAYRVTIEGHVGSHTLSSQRVSSEFAMTHALWTIGPDIARFGVRDSGGDDWAAASTRAWLTAHHGTLPPVGDVSGEHGVNLGYLNHETGHDVELLHFTRWVDGDLGRANVGAENFAALVQVMTAAATADSGSAAEREQLMKLSDWVRTARTGLDALLKDKAVQVVLFPRGYAHPESGLPAGWVRDLMRDGKVQLASGRVLALLDLTPAWIRARVLYQNNHNHHLDVQLAR